MHWNKGQEHVTSDTVTNLPSNNFNILRLILAITVIYSHSFIFTNSKVIEPTDILLGGQAYLAEIAVNFFFAISGLLITVSSFRSKGLWDFLKKRVLRIYPAFVVACLVCLFMIGPIGATSVSAYFAQLNSIKSAVNILLLNKIDMMPVFLNGLQPGQLNGSIWTIKIEFECYLVVAIVSLLGILRRRPLVLLFAICLYLLWIIMNSPLAQLIPFPERYFSHLRFLSYFFIGILFFLYREYIIYAPKYAFLSLAILGLSIQFGIFQMFLPAFGTYLLMWVAFNKSIRLHHFGKHADFSYGVYLYGWPVQQLLTFTFGNNLNPYVIFVAATLMTLPLAMLSWYAVEQPFLKLKSRAARPLFPSLRFILK